VVKIVLRERESAQEAVRRLRKIVERSGLKRELRRRERYEKPSDVRRKAKNRAIGGRKPRAHRRSADECCSSLLMRLLAAGLPPLFAKPL
jgi:small subunit ribosomal protein S21